MTVINTATGEIVEFDRAAAERRAERITLRLDAIADNYRAVLPMIREAIEKRDDLALGYRSPGDYVSDRFGQSLAGLGIEVRRAVVGELTAAGLSTRAIAPVVGVDQKTVVRDARVIRGEACASPDRTTPASPVVIGAGPTPEGVAPSPPEVEQEANQGVGAPASRPPVVGIDGKEYRRPEPKPRATPRRAITDQFFDAAYDVRQKVESLHRLIGDDRFPQNAEKVAAKHRNDLLRTRDLLEQVINRLPSA